MKTERQLIEECIEEKTKEYHQAAAELDSLSGDASSSSLANARDIMNKFTASQKLQNIEQELKFLQIRRGQLLYDNIEEEVIRGSKGEVLQHLASLPDGSYKLIRVIERESHGKE